MKKPTLVPVDAPRDFAIHELFFSTTDRKGIIRSGNDVFMRVSGYAESEMIGRPHNLIRHPDMPRAVFRLIWDHLLQGKAVAGYVKNLAADGRYYWVVAVITPLETGFLSVRFKPSGRLFDLVHPLYAEMRRIEAEAEAGDVAGNLAMDRSTERLLSALKEAGFPDYDTFMAVMVREELASRDARIAESRRELVPEHLVANVRGHQLENIYRQCLTAYRQLNGLYAGLGQYAQLDQDLREGFDHVATLTGAIRLVALNATIKAARLGSLGHCTAVVAEFLGRTSHSIAETCAAFSKLLEPVGHGLRGASFNLAAARLQLEMILSFSQELARLGHLDGSHGRDLDTLQTAFDGTIGPAVQALQSVEHALHGFRGHSETFSQLTLNLQVSQTVGAIEASRLAHDLELKQTFDDLRQQTDGCRTETSRLESSLSRFDVLAAASPAMINEINTAIQATRRSVKAFVALLDQAQADVPPPAVVASSSSAGETRSAGTPALAAV